MIFYYLAWLCWGYGTFIMEKGRRRLFLTATVLLLIIFSNTYVPLFQARIYVNGILLLVVGLYLITTDDSSKFISIVYSIILAMVYCIFHFIEIYDPLWIIIPRTYLLSILLCLSSIVLTFRGRRRLGIFFVGTFQGECMLSVTLYGYGFHNQIASLDYLAVISVSFIGFAMMQGVKKLLVFVEHGKQKQVKGMKGL